MTPEGLDELRCRPEDFAADVSEPFARADQRRWGGVHPRGLLLDGQRRSVEPMAARLVAPPFRSAQRHRDDIGGHPDASALYLAQDHSSQREVLPCVFAKPAQLSSLPR
ncbi:MAG TPA: transposase [Streptomyces sp.]|nr:transposase [Streptomyces sp.]HWU10619.1 transposase [Streptomyces sp.]